MTARTLWRMPKYDYAAIAHFCSRAHVMSCCRGLYWYGCPCLPSPTLRRERNLNVYTNLTCSITVLLNVMLHGHVHLTHVAKPLLWYYSQDMVSSCLLLYLSVAKFSISTILRLYFLAATKQLYEWYFLSVCPSVRLSVRLSVCPSVRLSVCPSVTPFWLCSHHRIIMKFSGVITLDQIKGPCKRSRSEVKGQGHRCHDPNFRFRTVTPVWIHIWW